MDLERIKTSLHDFVFACGCLMLIGVGFYFTGQLGCMFSWNGGNTQGVNMEMAGIIDSKGKFHSGK
jgi:hypothetical protein